MDTRDRRRRTIWLVLSVAPLLLVGAVVIVQGSEWELAPGRGAEGLRRATVRRMDLDVTVRVPGELNSARNTLIECEIERMSGTDGGGRGRGSDANRYSTLLSIVPEGTYVREGDVLCEIDPSGYVELARLQRIAVEEARAGESQALLDLEAAEVALAEYRDGLRPQAYDQLDVQVALARSELERQRGRMEWARRVRPLGYISSMRFEDEREALLRCELALERAELARDLYARHTEPKTLQTLQTQVDQSRTTSFYWRRKRELDEQALALYERQVETCAIRAPHEGYVIYAVDDDDPPIQPGVVVRRHMDLFHLPDLSQLVVRAQVNQTMIWRLAEGMRARVRVDMLPGRVFEGQVVRMPELPDTEDRRDEFSGVSNFLVDVRIDGSPEEVLLPGLSAQVEILTASRPDALVIPAEALAVEGGRTVCYVALPDGLERRPVTVAPGTIDLLRVVDGLDEGEQVVLDPQGLSLQGASPRGRGLRIAM